MSSIINDDLRSETQHGHGGEGSLRMPSTDDILQPHFTSFVRKVSESATLTFETNMQETKKEYILKHIARH